MTKRSVGSWTAIVFLVLPLAAVAQDTFSSGGSPSKGAPSMSPEQAKRCAEDRLRHYADEPFKQPDSCPPLSSHEQRHEGPPESQTTPPKPPSSGSKVPPKAGPSEPVATLPGVGRKPCVKASEFTDIDRAVKDLPQTSKSGGDSFNCFYYVRTVVEGARPKDLNVTTASSLTTNWSPATTYIDDAYLRAHNYYLLTKRATLTGERDFYEPGDIILVPGQDTSGLGRILAGNQRYTHAAVVLGTRGGRISRIRQKVDPFTCVVDLTPAEFAKVYAPQSVDGEAALYSVWRRAR